MSLEISDIGRLFMRRIIYKLYERRLRREVLRHILPQHVGIILDGNRRYAYQRGCEPQDIYVRGAKKLDEVLEWCARLRVSTVTLWVCSTENLRRSPKEVSSILSAIENKLKMLADDPRIRQHQVRVRAAGKLNLLPEAIADVIRATEAATASYNSMTLNIALAYSGREEIADAVRSLIRENSEVLVSPNKLAECITPAAIAKHLYLPDLPDPDLIIRTSGEIRLSGFLLWQSAYSEFYFSDVLWPEFREIDFLRAVRAYQQRKRRFGR